MPRRRSITDLEVLTYFIRKHGDDAYGLEIAKALGIQGGTLYPALRRLERDGVLTSRWEQIDPREEGRPRRRVYELNGAAGLQAAREAQRHLLDLAGSARPTLAPGTI